MYYFASDTHLGMDGRQSSLQRERLFVGWLDRVSADARAIYLVGDIFDFWFEFRKTVPKGFTRILGKLSELTDRGIRVHFFTGNHDMWTFDYLTTECGVAVHTKPEVFELAGKRIFVAHGDNMYVGKKPFWENFMQSVFHSRLARWIARTLVPSGALIAFGHRWSEHSRKSHVKTHVFKGEKEYLVRYAREYAGAVRGTRIDYFIFGHIHCAQDYDMGGGSRAIFLGEWLYNSTYAVMDENGRIELHEYQQE